MEYHDLYEAVRKEKYAETLQKFDKNFLSDFSFYVQELRKKTMGESDFFSDNVFEYKKQLENAFALFKGLILRRKKKLLNLVFVAAETGIMKRDYENMFEFEKKTFDNFVKAFEEGDRDLASLLHGKQEVAEQLRHKMILFNENISAFVDMGGNTLGPFTKGELAHLDASVGDILVKGGKATFVDEA